jgi:hypothetical protein
VVLPISYSPLIAGNGGVILEAPDTLPLSGEEFLGLDESGKMVLLDGTTTEEVIIIVNESILILDGGNF